MAKLSSSNGIEKFPKLRFPEFKEPWNLVKLEDVCSYRKGRAKVKKAQYISTENILQNYAGIEPYDDLSEAEGISIQCGDTLMANIRPYLKKVWQSNFNGACSTDVLAFSPDNIDGKFLYFLIAQDRFVNYVMCGAKGSKMPRGDKNHILEYETGVPTESEQRKIAHFIDLLNARISSQNSLINLIKKYKRGSLSALFPKKGEITPQYRFAGFTKPWEQRKLSEMCGTFEYGLNAAAKEFDGKNKYIRITDIDDASREFLLSDLSSPDICLDGMSKYLLSSGDIVFARTGASVGKTYIYRENDGIVYFAGFLIRAKVNQDNDAEFVFQSTLSPSYEKYIRITSQRSGQPGVNAQEYGEYDLFAPSKEEQQRIGHFLRGIDNLITLHQHKYDILLSLKNALLQQLFI